MNAKAYKIAPEESGRTSRVETLEITPEVIGSWEKPPFQRPLRTNAKVSALAHELRETGGVVPGVLTLGSLHGKLYIIDGQHRCDAFIKSELPTGLADVRTIRFESMAQMGKEFVNLNSSLVRMNPDDILRGMEGEIQSLAYIRENCPFIGYDHVRRGKTGPMLSMSVFLKCWAASAREVPLNGGSAIEHAKWLAADDARTCVEFLQACSNAWGHDREYARLWGALNLTMCMWLYRRTVLEKYSQNTERLAGEIFTKCLMSISADPTYRDWLVGRLPTDRDRGPAYARVKAIFARRAEQELGRKIRLPSPAWGSR